MRRINCDKGRGGRRDDAGAIDQVEGSWPLRSRAGTSSSHITVWHGAVTVRITNWIQEHLFTEDESGRAQKDHA